MFLLHELAVYLDIIADSLVLVGYLLHPTRLVAQLGERYYGLETEITASQMSRSVFRLNIVMPRRCTGIPYMHNFGISGQQ